MKLSLSLLIAFLSLSCFASFLAKKRESLFTPIAYFLLFTVLIEASGYFLMVYTKNNNQWLYNIYLFVEILFTTWLVTRITKKDKPKKIWSKIPTGFLLILLLIELFYKGFNNYGSITNAIFSVYIVVYCCLFYFQLLNDEDTVINDIELLQHIPFWIISGLFFFYFTSAAFNLFFDYFISRFILLFFYINILHV